MTTALVTGANRGIGRHLASQLLERGAKVYAAARRPETLDLPGAVPVALDITDPDAVAAAAALATDVDLLINNAGVSTGATLLGDLGPVRTELDVNFWGTLAMVRAFAPVLAANGGGAVVNVASALSWFAFPGAGAYAVSKAANWNMSNALRLELAGQGTQVTSVHLGAADTDMMKDYDGDKTDPATVAARTLDAVAAGELEVVVDEWSAMVKASLARDPREFYAGFLPA
ncbi:SDR family oxidoreductase [Kineococcus aurantiacus]|uniref:NAD(P)-dependent dehydrogenase (Short-subunit alcohol dehydrogenase family) n=1 Tax=Kineococcus aurantiacus TaxID=37633 RepID=A0A7Y9DKZ8_9ACTN|nr:SDR family oxidoreductase [Kineococcus aurantiacus]NYD22542.1 NAD(P)-dependent dehydrogenase (short-subunit alcohol dehydrogenase family) [Kineococcus aurantiacus]